MENNFFKKDVYLTMTGLGYEFNINVPWYWTNWFLIVMTRMWCWLDWPRPTGDVSGCGRPRGHPSWDEHTPGQPSPAESRERERSRAGSRAKHYIRTRDGELYRDRTVLVTRRTISIALNLFCNQGIKCSSWGSMAAAVHWHWSVFSLTINRAGYSLCPGPCRRISAPRLISCDWQLAFALIVRCWDCLNFTPRGCDSAADWHEKIIREISTQTWVGKITQPRLSRQMISGLGRLNISTIYIRSCLGCLVSRYDLCHDIKDQTIF